RLAHAHEDDVGNPPDRVAPLLEEDVEMVNLLDNLSRGQVSFDAVDPAGTKLTTDRASDLRRHAGGAAVTVGDHYGFGLRAVRPGEEELAGAVLAELIFYRRGGRECDMFVQKGTIPLGKVGHPL